MFLMVLPTVLLPVLVLLSRLPNVLGPDFRKFQLLPGNLLQKTFGVHLCVFSRNAQNYAEESKKHETHETNFFTPTLTPP